MAAEAEHGLEAEPTLISDVEEASYQPVIEGGWDLGPGIELPARRTWDSWSANGVYFPFSLFWSANAWSLVILCCFKVLMYLNAD